MRNEFYYAYFPTKLYQQHYKNKTDRNLHLLAMSIITSWVNTGTGRFHLSERKLAEELDCSTWKAREIIQNFLKWGFLKKISEGTNQHKKTYYELSTYNFTAEDNQAAKQAPEQVAQSIDIQVQEEDNQAVKQAPDCSQTNNELTNNDITNNEKEINNKSSSSDSSFEFTQEDREALYEAYLETFNAICSEKKILALTDRRRNQIDKIENLLSRIGVGWKEVCQIFRQSSWIYRQPFATFDWLTKPDNLVNVIEGKYLEQQPQSDTDIEEPELPQVEKTYPLDIIRKLKTHKLAKQDYLTAELLSLLKKHYVKHSENFVLIKADEYTHRLIRKHLAMLAEQYLGVKNAA